MNLSLDKSQKLTLLRIGIAVVLLVIACLLPLEGWMRLCAFLVPYFVAGYDILWDSVKSIGHGKVFDENFLMSVATVGALVLGEYPEAVFVMLFFQAGEFFEDYAVDRSRESISRLTEIMPETAVVLRNGTEETVAPGTVSIGETVVIRPGERVPLDGVVRSGSSSLDTSALTGESLPRAVSAGDEILSGCINGEGLLFAEVTKTFEKSAVSRILELVEQASGRKARTENFITRFARYYTPVVVGVAVLIAAVPPLFFDQAVSDWVFRALIFLVVSCPCALVLSVPLAFFGGIGAASRAGILVKGGNYLEMLARTETIVFDKTGTLTTGKFAVSSYDEAALKLAAAAGRGSTHPLSVSICEACNTEMTVTEAAEHRGRGIEACLDGVPVLSGSRTFLAENGVAVPETAHPGSAVHVARGGVYIGSVYLRDELKPEAAETFAELGTLGIQSHMLTGDRASAAEEISRELDITSCRADLLPQDKVSSLEELLSAKKKGTYLAYVGDGINDAPVLARADIGIAMGAFGSDAAIAAADIVLVDDRLDRIPAAIRISRKTRRIVFENIIFALGVKFAVLVLAVCGLASMWMAIFADVGVALLAILNSVRMLGK